MAISASETSYSPVFKQSSKYFSVPETDVIEPVQTKGWEPFELDAGLSGFTGFFGSLTDCRAAEEG